jgi:hypothetical protein
MLFLPLLITPVAARDENGEAASIYDAMEIALYHTLGRLPEPDEFTHRFCCTLAGAASRKDEFSPVRLGTAAGGLDYVLVSKTISRFAQ